MMVDFLAQLDAYAFPESIENSKEYLTKYWLSKQEYFSKWKVIQSILFSEKEFPEMVFKPGFELLVRKGGVLFEQKEFKLLKECIKTTKDSCIIIVEDYNEEHPPHNSGPILRFKYPASITWEEINIGDGISYELLQRPIRNFFVFGDTGRWGKYVANDYELPIDVFGFTKEFEVSFKQKFQVSKEEHDELECFLPNEYKVRI